MTRTHLTQLLVGPRDLLIPFLLACGLALALFQSADAQSQLMEEALLAEPFADIAADAGEKGDPTQGAIIFHSPRTGCGKCHSTTDDTGFGPNLSIWKREVNDEHLIRSVLEPSAHIEPAYQNIRILTADGRTFVGLVLKRTDRELILRTGPGEAATVTIDIDNIEAEKKGEVSVMPAGQVNALRQRQDFLDLVSYLTAIRDGGPKVAAKLQPSEDALTLMVPEYESDIDHKGMISDWNNESLKRGNSIYRGLCVNCHGTIEKAGSLPTSLRFASGQFKFGSDPYSMYQTLTHGGGLMVPQTWMVPQQKYDVIHYIREHFLRDKNPSQYAAVTDKYLASLPSGSSRGPEPTEIKPWTTMDYGPMLTTTIEFGNGGKNIAQKAIAIRLDEGPGGVVRGSRWMVFEHDTLRMAAAWSGSFLDWNGIQFNGRHGVHLRANGNLHAINSTGPGWANPATRSFEDNQRVEGRDKRKYGPLPAAWGKFHGLHRYEDKVILSYTISNTPILEYPNSLAIPNVTTFVRTLNVGPRDYDLDMSVMELPSDATLEFESGLATIRYEDKTVLVAAEGYQDATQFRLQDNRLVLTFKKGNQPLKGSIFFTDSKVDQDSMKEIETQLAALETNLELYTHGGPAQYTTAVDVPAKKWFESEAWLVDELVRPEGNPWGARTRITGMDFYPDGTSLAACTWDGDVWKVEGINTLGQPDGSLRWHRIATGLFQPLGILVDEERLLVTCRDQIVSLGDSNGDGEMDDYRCFNSDHQVTEHFHEFAMGLQRDSDGNLYYAKSARHALKAVVPHHGTLLRVAADGSKTDIIATGFRAANGVCLNDDGSFIVTDQEGHWNPKNRINWVRPGGFYGNMYGYHDVTDSSDKAMQQPLCWITNSFDRSPAELLWADTEKWGPLNGQLLNLSYGYGRIYVVPHEHLSTPTGERQPQGGMCQLPIPDLPTGMIRGRFSPTDGQLYLGGMFSWAGSRQEEEGGLFRVTYKGNPVSMPTQLKASKETIDITFSESINPDSVGDTGRYKIKIWDLKRTKNYGSKHYNEKPLEVVSAILLPDMKTIRLTIPDIAPTWGMEIACRLQDQTGKEFRRVIHNTIHQLGEK